MSARKPNYASKKFIPLEEFRRMLGIGKTTLHKWRHEKIVPPVCNFGQYIRTITEGEYEIFADIKLAGRFGPAFFNAECEEILAEVKRQLGAVPDWVLELVARTREEIDEPMEVGRKRESMAVAALPSNHQ